MSILGKKGVTPEMEFKCKDCGDVATGQDVLNGEYLYIAHTNREDPIRSLFRCECCQDDHDDRENN